MVVAAIIEQIDQHPMEAKTTTEYAKEASLNRKRFQAAFKYLTGTGVQEYRLNRRMLVASQHLQEDQKSIKEIAALCNFKSQRAFTAAFKKAFNMTPKEYLKLNAS
jgi:AraC-like DNA-binding protein